jgi:hypothetical protein
VRIQEVRFNSLSRYSTQPRPAHLPADDCTDNDADVEAVKKSDDGKPRHALSDVTRSETEKRHEKGKKASRDGSRNSRAHSCQETVENDACLLRGTKLRQIHEEIMVPNFCVVKVPSVGTPQFPLCFPVSPVVKVLPDSSQKRTSTITDEAASGWY